MSKNIIAKGKRRKLAKLLIHQNQEEGLSWRALEEIHHVAAGTLCRIAKSRGEWLPKDTAILEKLDLITIRSPYAVMPRWWRRTPEALAEFLHIRGNAKTISDETRAEQYSYRKKR